MALDDADEELADQLPELDTYADLPTTFTAKRQLVVRVVLVDPLDRLELQAQPRGVP